MMRRHPLLSFFVLANLLSWMVWAPLAIAGLGWTTARFPPALHLVGGLGPLLAALIVTAVCTGRAGLARWVARSLAVRGRLGWMVFAIAAPPLLLLASAALLRGTGQGHVAWADVGRSSEYPALSRAAYAVVNILFYGFGEEVGWRGFALPRLQARHSALTAALLVSGAWALWHLPLFAFAGGLSSLGIGGILGWLSSIVTGSILMTWLFNSSRGSIVAVAVFHGMLDIVMTSPGGSSATFLMGAAITIIGLVIPVALGKTNLAHRPRVQERCETTPLVTSHPSEHSR